MNQPSQPFIDVDMVFHQLAKYRTRWMLPTVGIATIALIFAVFHTPKWEASQALLVRDEMIGSSNRTGRFDDPELMKTAQETLLELAKSRSLLTSALIQVGTPAGYPWNETPPVSAIEDLEKAIKIKAPNGAEFGRTEIFYVTVRDKNRDRAIALLNAVCDQLDIRLKDLRDSRARNLVDELSNTANLASHDLQEVTSRLTETERSVGNDLAELRILNESSSGESNLRRTLVQVRNELRQAERTQQSNVQFEQFLLTAQQDPYQLLTVPSVLIQSHQALQQLRDGLVAAKLRTAQLLGDLTPLHPRAKASIDSQRVIEQNIHDELTTSLGTVRSELQLGDTQVGQLKRQVAEIEQRMNQLAAVRADYGNLVIEVAQRGQILNRAEQDLSDARAGLAAAKSVSLITMLDEPTTGDSPVGPGRSMIALFGLFGGLTTGLGLVFLTVPSTDPNRQTDTLANGSSSSDICDAASRWAIPVGQSFRNFLSRFSKFAANGN